MDAHTIFISCPYLDRLGRDLIQAHRSIEDRDVFELACGAETPGNNVSGIHAAMTQHRRNCPICRAEVATASRAERTMHIQHSAVSTEWLSATILCRGEHSWIRVKKDSPQSQLTFKTLSYLYAFAPDPVPAVEGCPEIG